MDKVVRLQYLQAMGIDVWAPREQLFPTTVNMAEAMAFEAKKPENQLEEDLDSWVDLQQKVSDCQQCSLCHTRNNIVFGSGNKDAEWMVVGEAPGQEEDAQGLPFVGPAGKLLVEMIRAIDLERESVYITNVLKCSSLSSRDPKVEEISQCFDYLKQQIDLVKPKIILAVGRIAAQTLLQTKKSLSELRGLPHQVDGIPLVVIYHPAYLLRFLHEKPKAWQDLQLAMKQFKK